MALKTDFKDDIFEGNRKYKLSQDGTGNTEIQDVTVYSQEGDLFTAEHINATNEAVNGLSEDMVDLKKSVSDGKTQVAAAITAKRVPTAATATFREMAANIGKIVLGSGNAVPSDVLAGKTFTNNDGKEYTGTMPKRGDYNGWGNSKGNDAGNQRMWVRLPGGYYNKNAEVYLSWADIRAMAGITPEKVKKNESIMGIIGSFEGWVGDAGDLYINGANNAGFTPNSSCGFLQDRITLSGTPLLKATRSYTITTSQRLYVQGGGISGSFGAGQSGSKYITLSDPNSGTIDSIKIGDGEVSERGFSFTIGRNVTFAPQISFPYASNGWRGYITRIYIA